jgi:two-component system cell cycle response regulator
MAPLDPRFGVPRVLLVEDSPVQARVVAAQLEQGWDTPDSTEIASSLATAIAALRRQTFNCVLLDLGRPDADGLEAVKRIRMAAPGVAIVVLSGQEDDALALLAVREGAQDYLVKGRVDHNHIVRAISYAIERKQQQAVLVHQALHDGLTGLANRAQILSRIEIAASRHHRHGETSALIFLDLDGFKAINDQYGHAVGDRVLVEVARRLETIASQRRDVVARLGGDEFVIVGAGIATMHDAATFAERILRTMRRPIIDGDNVHELSASIGVSFFPIDGTEMKSLIEQADMALYEAKHAGKDRVSFASASSELCEIPLPAAEPPDVVKREVSTLG